MAVVIFSTAPSAGMTIWETHEGPLPICSGTPAERLRALDHRQARWGTGALLRSRYRLLSTKRGTTLQRQRDQSIEAAGRCVVLTRKEAIVRWEADDPIALHRFGDEVRAQSARERCRLSERRVGRTRSVTYGFEI